MSGTTARCRPMLFSGPMVRALLEGRKTQTRRLVPDFMARHIRVLTDADDPPDLSLSWGPMEHDQRRRRQSLSATQWRLSLAEYPDEGAIALGPLYGGPGDSLWVRETWACVALSSQLYRTVYRADLEQSQSARYRWRSPLHMPRIRSRLTLTIRNVRLERLHAMSGEDAKAEGLSFVAGGTAWAIPGIVSTWQDDPRAAFSAFWDCLNQRRAPWASNPWVLAVEFKLTRAPGLLAVSGCSP